MPFEVAFDENVQGVDPGVKIISHINNLNPHHHRALYSSIDHIISASIEPWNQVFVYTDRPRKPPPIRTYGVPWQPPFPESAYHVAEKEHLGQIAGDMDLLEEIEGYLTEPELPLSRDDYVDLIRLKHKITRTRWDYQEPGVSFSYQQWKVGVANRAIIPKQEVFRYGGRSVYTLRPIINEANHEFHSVDLRMFRERGLQMVVRLTSLDLSPENAS